MVGEEIMEEHLGKVDNEIRVGGVVWFFGLDWIFFFFFWELFEIRDLFFFSKVI